MRFRALTIAASCWICLITAALGSAESISVLEERSLEGNESKYRRVQDLLSTKNSLHKHFWRSSSSGDSWQSLPGRFSP